MGNSYLRFDQSLDWNLLKIFWEIADAGGVSRAAKRLDRKQPALSLALRRLERRLGVVLCDRGPAGFALSNEGRLLYEMCASLTQLVSQIPAQVAQLGATLHGQIRLQLVSGLVSQVIDKAIVVVHTHYPRLEFTIGIGIWERMGKLLLRDEADVAIAPTGFFQPELKYDFLFKETHMPYCGGSHPLFGQTLTDPDALRNYSFVITGDDEADELLKFRQAHGLGLRFAGTSDHLDEAKRLTCAGVGICLLPVGFADPDVAAGRLWPLLPLDQAPSIDIYLITNRSISKRPARDAFVDALYAELAASER